MDTPTFGTNDGIIVRRRRPGPEAEKWRASFGTIVRYGITPVDARKKLFHALFMQTIGPAYTASKRLSDGCVLFLFYRDGWIIERVAYNEVGQVAAVDRLLFNRDMTPEQALNRLDTFHKLLSGRN